MLQVYTNEHIISSRLCDFDPLPRFYAVYGNRVLSAQLLEVSLVGAGTVLRLERGVWSIGKIPSYGKLQISTPPPQPPLLDRFRLGKQIFSCVWLVGYQVNIFRVYCCTMVRIYQVYLGIYPGMANIFWSTVVHYPSIDSTINKQTLENVSHLGRSMIYLRNIYL